MHEVINWFADFDISTVVHPDDPYYTLEEIRPTLETLKQTSQDILTIPEMWNELPPGYQNVIIQELDTMRRILIGIVENRKDASWLASNSANQIASVKNVYNALYERFVSPVRAFRISTETVQKKTEIALKRLEDAITQAEASSLEARKSATVAGEAATDTAIGSLAEFFENSVTGHKSAPTAKEKRKHQKTWWIRHQYQKTMSSQRGYTSAARLWFMMVLITITGTALFSYWVFHGVNFETLTPQAVLAKALILAAPAYSIRFSVRNYNANKHLATANRHRAIIMQTLLALLSRDEVGESAKEQVIVEATSRVFDPGESGYLTSKDAVSGSNTIDVPFNTRV